MGVVIDGQQWENCNGCGTFTKFQDLGYLKPTPVWNCGLDLCVRCADAGIRDGFYRFDEIVPAASWQTYEVR